MIQNERERDFKNLSNWMKCMRVEVENGEPWSREAEVISKLVGDSTAAPPPPPPSPPITPSSSRWMNEAGRISAQSFMASRFVRISPSLLISAFLASTLALGFFFFFLSSLVSVLQYLPRVHIWLRRLKEHIGAHGVISIYLLLLLLVLSLNIYIAVMMR